MPEQARQEQWNDHKVEIVVGNLLRTGVILAAAVVLLGGVAYLVKYGSTTPQYQTFEPAELRSPWDIIIAVVKGRPRGLIALGLLFLIATPVARVAFTIFAFLKEKDYMYVGITAVVLAVLLFSLFFGNRL